MAKELDKEIIASDSKSSSSKDASKSTKDTEKAKKENEKRSLKAASAKKPKMSVKKFYKDAKAEFKKVVWPTPKQVFNNTTVVLTCIAATALAIWGLDSIFASALRLLFKMD